jgi:hypothetical protein
MIKGFNCQKGEVEFKDCFSCDRECMPRPYLDFIIDGAKDERAMFSPSMIWNCPRNVLLNQYCEVFIEPKQRYWLFFGTMTHTILEQWNRPGLIKEKRIKFNLGNYQLSGQPDCLSPKEDGTYELIDFKTIKMISLDKEGQPKWEWLKKQDYIGQLSVYAHGLKQHGIEVTSAKLYYFAKMDEFNKQPLPTCLAVPISIDEKLVQDAIKRLDFIKGYYDLKKLPAIEDCQKEYRWKCEKYCEYYQKCMEVG